MAEIKQDHFYGRGSRDNMIRVLNCADGLSDINGCELSRGCTSGVGLNLGAVRIFRNYLHVEE